MKHDALSDKMINDASFGFLHYLLQHEGLLLLEKNLELLRAQDLLLKDLLHLLWSYHLGCHHSH